MIYESCNEKKKAVGLTQIMSNLFKPIKKLSLRGDLKFDDISLIVC